MFNSSDSNTQGGEFSNLYPVTKTVRFELKPTITTNAKIQGLFQIKDKIDWVDNLLFYSRKINSSEARKNGEEKLKEYLERCNSQIQNLETIKSNFQNKKYLEYKIGVIDGLYVKKYDPDVYYKMKKLGKWKYKYYPYPKFPGKYEKDDVEFNKTKNQISLAQLNAFSSNIKFTEFIINEFERVVQIFRQSEKTICSFLFEDIDIDRENQGILAGLHTKEERISKIKLAFGITLKIHKYLANLQQFELNIDQSHIISSGKAVDFNLQINKYLQDQGLFLELQQIIDTLNFYTNNEKRNPIRKWSLNMDACKPRPNSGQKGLSEREIYQEIFQKESELETLRQRQSKLKILKFQIKKSIGIVLECVEDKFYEDETEKNPSIKYKINDSDLIDITNNRESIISFLNNNLNISLTQYTINYIDDEINHILDCLYFTPDEERDNFALKYYTSNIGYYAIISEIAKNRKQILPEFKEGLASKVDQLRKDLENVKITHFGRIIQKENKYYLALENLDSDKKQNELELFDVSQLSGNTASVIQYDSMTFKALRKLCIDKDGTIKSNYLKDQNGQAKKSKVTRKPIKEITDLWGKYIESLEENKPKLLRADFIKFKLILQGIFRDNPGVFSRFNFDISNCENMKSLIQKIDKDGYKITTKQVDFEKILKLEKEGKVELYQIYNKDFELDEKCAITESDKLKIERQKSKVKDATYKPNLYTIYWNNLFEQVNSGESKKIRISPEGKFYIKLATENSEEQSKIFDISKVGNECIVSNNRKTQNKIYGDFQLIFNPITTKVDQTSKDSKTRIESFNNYIKQNITQDEIVVIGLDRGENSLVSYSMTRFKKQVITDNDIKVRFETKTGENDWVLDEIIETGDLSCVKVFNKNANWKTNQFVEQRQKPLYFIEKDENYLDNENKNEATSKAKELSINGQKWEVLPIYIKDTNHERDFKPSGAYSVECLSWQEADGVCYNYKVKQQILTRDRLEREIFSAKVKNRTLFEDEEILSAREFKNGFVSQLVNLLAQKVTKYKAFISFEDLNHGSKNVNLNKTFGSSVYQIIENKIMQKLSYCTLKIGIDSHIQTVPKVTRIEELKTDIVTNKSDNKNYKLGNVLITDEDSTSKICPNCGYSKNRKKVIKLDKDIILLDLKLLDLKTDDQVEKNKADFGVGTDKKTKFIIDNETKAYIYSPDGVSTIVLKNGEDYKYTKFENGKDKEKTHTFIDIISDPRQNETKSKDFIRCVYCGFDSRHPENNHQRLNKITGGDELAAYNIAKRGLELISKD